MTKKIKTATDHLLSLLELHQRRPHLSLHTLASAYEAFHALPYNMCFARRPHDQVTVMQQPEGMSPDAWLGRPISYQVSGDSTIVEAWYDHDSIKVLNDGTAWAKVPDRTGRVAELLGIQYVPVTAYRWQR